VTVVMGILNVTPDSFSDGGRYLEPEAAVARALEMEEEGAGIIDIGAESTRPGHTPISPDEEWRRLEPVLARLAGRLKVPISIDTYHAETARRAAQYGIAIVNDVSMLRDPDMPAVVRHHGLRYVLMHTRRQVLPGLPVAAMVEELHRPLAQLTEEGVPARDIIIDPGIGFGKTREQDLACLAEIGRFQALGHPVLVGASRKRVVGHALGGVPVGERLAGSLAVVAHACMAGVDIVRVHDVRDSVRVVRMMEAILAHGGSFAS